MQTWRNIVAVDDDDNERLGYILSLAGFAAFSAVDALSKILSETHSLPQILFLSGLFASAFAVLLAAPLGGLVIYSRQGAAVIVLRGVMSVAMIWLSVSAISLMPIANVYSIRFLAPVMTVLLAMVLLRERPPRLQWIALFFCMVGIVLILDPGGATELLAVSLAAGAAIAQALSTILVRVWKAHSTPLADMLIPMGVLVLMTGLMLPGRYVQPTYGEWLLYAAAGGLLCVGRLCLTISLRLAPSSKVAAVQYTQLLWGLVFGWLFFADLPTLTVLAGAAMIIAASALGIGQLRPKRVD